MRLPGSQDVMKAFNMALFEFSIPNRVCNRVVVVGLGRVGLRMLDFRW